MGLRDKIKVNKVSLDFNNYYYYIKGVPKCGKTTFARDLTLELYNNPEAGLLISIGDEKGYKALDNLQAVDCEDWAEFEEVVDDLVENYDEYKGIKLVYIDTVDELIRLAEEEACRVSQRQTGKKCTLNSAFSGYGAGRQYVSKIVTEKMALLNKLYGVVCIGHTKLRTIKEMGMESEQEYQVLDSNLNKDMDNIFGNKADIIGVVNVERDVNSKTKRIEDTKRYLYFRNNGFVNAGGRFGNIVEKTEFTAKNFVIAVEDAIKNSMVNPISDEEFKKAKAKEIEENKAKAEEFANNHVSDVDISVDDLKALIKGIDETNRKKLIAKVKELNINMKDLDNEDKDKLKELAKFIKTL